MSRGEALGLSGRGQLELLRAAVEQGVAVRVTALGHSMRPFIRDADVLTIAPLVDREPSCGDVVAFVAVPGERLAVHRVVGTAEGGWLVRGDGACSADGVVKRDSVLGRVVRVQRRGREVRFGIGYGGTFVAALSRRDVLAHVGQVVHTARRTGVAALDRVQGTGAYRAAVRRLRVSSEICGATREQLQAVRSRRAPDARAALTEGGLGATVVVARRRGRVVGLAQHVRRPLEESPWDGHWLVALTVRAPYRRLGVGEALARRVIEQARAAGADELKLAVFDDNTRALRLYEKLGFARITVPGLEAAFMEEMGRHGRRRIVMRRDLASRVEAS